MGSDHASLRPIEVLNYAAKHGYNDLANKAAFFTVDQPLEKIAGALSQILLPHWVSGSFRARGHVLMSYYSFAIIPNGQSSLQLTLNDTLMSMPIG